MEKIIINIKRKSAYKNGLNNYENLPRIQITQLASDFELDKAPSNRSGGSSTGTTTVPFCVNDSHKASLIDGIESGGCKMAKISEASTIGAYQQDQSQFPKQLPMDTLTTTQYERSALNRQSTGTLNRLILVAQALENELDWSSRHRNEFNSDRIVCTIRMSNIVLLALINILLFTGVGQYHAKTGSRLSLWLTPNKWYFQREMSIIGGGDLPITFSAMQLTGQFCAAGLSIGMLVVTLILQSFYCFGVQQSRLMCIFYSFACVPFSLFIFGLEMHYSACPWLDDFYRTEMHRRNYQAVEKYIDTQCGINGWALAGIFALLSCGLFVSEGLITAFFQPVNSQNNESKKPEVVV